MRDRKEGESLADYLTTGRYQYFVDNVLPRLRGSDITNIVIVIPSYYDFIRYIFTHLGLLDVSFYTSNRSIPFA